MGRKAAGTECIYGAGCGNFTRIRQMLANNTDLRLEIEKIKTKLDNQDKNMEIVFRYLDELLEKQEKPNPPRKRIGFKPDSF